MANRKSVDNTRTWISDEQKIHEREEYGENQRSVTDAISEQEKRVQLVRDYHTTVQKVSKATKDDHEKEDIVAAYDGLAAVASHRLGCLEDIGQIAGLEDMFGALTVQFAQRATTLVENETQKSHPEEGQESEGVARAAQNCILAVRSNWAWISKLVKCADIHLQHVTEYHQFFHEACEFRKWMPIELNKAVEKVQVDSDSATGSKRESDKILVELKELLSIFLHWQGKLDQMLERSKKVVPVHLRTKPLDYFRPIVSLCQYKTKDINLREGEELTLINNAKPQSWQVRNMHHTESFVPSIVCLIPGPDPDAVNTAMKLRLHLLGVWTQNIKRVGKDIIRFLLLVIKPGWTKKEIQGLKAIPDNKKRELVSYLIFIDDSLSPYWAEYAGYQELNKRITKLREILGQQGKDKDYDSSATNAYMERYGTARDIIKSFQDFWKYWETFKILTETSQHSEHILISEQWEQLKFMEASELLKRWHTGGFRFDETDSTDYNSFGRGQNGVSVETEVESLVETQVETQVTNVESEVVVEESITGITSSQVHGSRTDEEEGQNGVSANIRTERETAETEALTHHEQEEQQRFVITGVMDTRTNTEVSMAEAVKLGLIRNEEGMYINKATGESIPIPVAMNAGFIKVEVTTVKRSAEKRRDVGLITIKTERESRPYTVKGIMDTRTDTQVSVDEAIKHGWLDQTKGMVRNIELNEDMTLADALDSGILVVEFDADAVVDQPEVISKTYAIHGIVDQRSKKKVTFTEGLKLGLLDRDSGAYYHNVTRESIYVGDAIKRGFIKATVVKDPSSMDIAPENRMVTDRMKSIKSKLLNPMKAMAALKMAGDNDDEFGDSEERTAILLRLQRQLAAMEGETNPGLLARICKAALPLQMLMLLLLGVACLVPMCEEEFNCALQNNFEESAFVMLKYGEGPPPI